jgi:hypothetical protein
MLAKCYGHFAAPPQVWGPPSLDTRQLRQWVRPAKIVSAHSKSITELNKGEDEYNAGKRKITLAHFTWKTHPTFKQNKFIFIKNLHTTMSRNFLYVFPGRMIKDAKKDLGDSLTV